MSIPDSPEDFTVEQAAVIALPVQAHTLVSAAAGTGKTHTLAGRLIRLIDGEGLSAGDDVLVLSFSRAAVAELKRRITGLSGDARYVGVATFDSFATRILAAAAYDGQWSHLDYEGRVCSAVRIMTGSQVPDEVKLVRHILIDEIQDLVGPRAELVMALLLRAQAGFTIFGDPAQAIYGHQAGQQGSDSASPELYRWVREHFASDLVTLQLTQDHRAATQQTREIAVIGAMLRKPEPDQAAVSHKLRSVLLGLPVVGMTAARRMLIREDGETSAVLTRTNGEALVFSRAMFIANIPHRYQRRGEEKVAPAWLSGLAIGLEDTRVTQATLEPRLEQVAKALSVDPDELYGLLRTLAPGRGREIDMRRLADRIYEEDLPEALNEIVPSRTVVSTIHRAKGLEFDRVLLTDPTDRDAGDLGEQNRIIYVALSRSRREIFHVDCPDTAGLSRDRATGRWVKRGFGAAWWRVREFEVTGPDTHARYPAGAWLLMADVAETQEYMRTAVKPGDPVTLKLLDQRVGESYVGHYGIYHGHRPVGLTSEEFGRVLGSVLRARSPSAWPGQIDGLHVELVDTVAGDGSVGRAHSLGTCGLWLRVRVFGLGTLQFGDGDSVGGADGA
jgi:AAA domain/UvrD-like helicase C-terminal domain